MAPFQESFLDRIVISREPNVVRRCAWYLVRRGQYAHPRMAIRRPIPKFRSNQLRTLETQPRAPRSTLRRSLGSSPIIAGIHRAAFDGLYPFRPCLNYDGCYLLREAISPRGAVRPDWFELGICQRGHEHPEKFIVSPNPREMVPTCAPFPTQTFHVLPLSHYPPRTSKITIHLQHLHG